MTYPGFVFRSLCKDGYSARDLLKGTGLKEEHLSDPEFRCGFDPLRLLLRNALELSGDPHLGIRLAKRFEPTYIGLPAYAAMNAPRFRDALVILNQFFFLAFPAMEFLFPDHQADVKPGFVAIRLRPKFPFKDIEYFARISALVACETLFKSTLRCGRVVQCAESTISKPAGWETVSHEVGFPVRFETREDRLVLAVSHLVEPLPAHDPINHSLMVALCEKFARNAVAQSTAVGQVQAYLEKQRSSNVTASQVAAALGYSERALRRALEQNGTSYRRLLEQARRLHAQEMLAGTTFPIKTIAFELGFDTPSNFARSFKRWAGTSPKAFRDARKPRSGAGQN